MPGLAIVKIRLKARRALDQIRDSRSASWRSRRAGNRPLHARRQYSGLPDPDADLRIRAAQSSDLDALVQLETKAFASDRLSRRRVPCACSGARRRLLLVASRGGRLAGYALVLMRRGSARGAALFAGGRPGTRGPRDRFASAGRGRGGGDEARGADAAARSARRQRRRHPSLRAAADIGGSGDARTTTQDGAAALLYAREPRPARTPSAGAACGMSGAA